MNYAHLIEPAVSFLIVGYLVVASASPRTPDRPGRRKP